MDEKKTSKKTRFMLRVGTGLTADELILTDIQYIPNTPNIEATLIAELAYRRYNSTSVYKACEPRKIIVSPGSNNILVLVEFDGDFEGNVNK